MRRRHWIDAASPIPVIRHRRGTGGLMAHPPSRPAGGRACLGAVVSGRTGQCACAVVVVVERRILRHEEDCISYECRLRGAVELDRERSASANRQTAGRPPRSRPDLRSLLDKPDFSPAGDRKQLDTRRSVATARRFYEADRLCMDGPDAYDTSTV